MAGQMTDLRERGLILGQQRELLGETWAKGWFQALRTEGRPVAGGWPGTLQEARYRARMHCDRELSRCGQPPLSQEELDLIAAAIYERAKRDWMRVVREAKVARSSSS
jgi:hypothetical protein